MTDQEQRIKTLEEQVEKMADGYLQTMDLLSNSQTVNGQKYHSLIDLAESLEARFQVLLELLGQAGVVDLEEFRKYQTTVHRLAKKKRLERSFQQEVNE